MYYTNLSPLLPPPPSELSTMPRLHELDKIYKSKRKKTPAPIADIYNNADEEYASYISKQPESFEPDLIDKNKSNDSDVIHNAYSTLPAWADPSSPEYNPVKFLAEWGAGPEKFINPYYVKPVNETKSINWFQKLIAFFGLGDSSNRVKIEKIRSDERIKLKELEMEATISKDCKNDIHRCDDWKFIKTISVYGVGGNTKYPIRFDNIYGGTCKHCKSPVLKKLVT